MGSIGSIWQQVDAAGASGASSSSANASGTNSMSNTTAFLQLLIAQLKNQDPTQPVDPTAFVTQLAEYNDVEQNLAARQDLDAMSEKYLGLTTPPSAGGVYSNTGAASGSASQPDQTNGVSGSGSSGSGL